MPPATSATASSPKRTGQAPALRWLDWMNRVVRSAAFQSATAFLLPIAGGCLLACAFPPVNWNDAVWVALVPFCIAVASKKALASYLGAYLGGFAFYLIGLDWIRTCYGGTGFSGPLVLPWVLVAQVMAPSWLVGMWFGRLLYHRLRWPMSLSIALAWVGGAFIGQATSLLLADTEFHWLDPAATQVDRLWLIQIADLGGSSLVTLLIAFSNGTLVDIAVCKPRWKHAVRLSAILVVVGAYGLWRLHQSSSAAAISVCLAPTNASLVPTGTVPPAVRGADILLWPESALGNREAIGERATVDGLQQLATWSGSWWAWFVGSGESCGIRSPSSLPKRDL